MSNNIEGQLQISTHGNLIKMLPVRGGCRPGCCTAWRCPCPLPGHMSHRSRHYLSSTGKQRGNKRGHYPPDRDGSECYPTTTPQHSLAPHYNTSGNSGLEVNAYLATLVRMPSYGADSSLVAGDQTFTHPL